MPKILNCPSQRKDSILAFVLTRDQMDKFYDLKPREQKQSDLMRSILFEWMKKREKELSLECV